MPHNDLGENVSTPSLADLAQRTTDPTGLCVLYLLTWIAVSDGELAQPEWDHLLHVAKELTEDVEQILELVRASRRADLQLACTVVQRLDQEQRLSFLSLAIAAVMADGVVRGTEVYILQFLADLCGLDRTSFDEFFLRDVGRPLPKVGDVSSRTWWRSRSSQGKRSSRDSERAQRTQQDRRRQRTEQKATGGHRTPWSGRSVYAEALAQLGLPPDASVQEVRIAYRRLVRQHHPDRYETQGPQAVREATRHFQLIQQAYEFLMNALP
jgi:DnaJ like chaperone protein